MTDDDIQTRSVDELPGDEPGDYVEVDGETAVIEEVLGGRARLNFGVVAYGDDARVETCSADDLPGANPSPGDVVEVDGERAVVESILGGRARVNFSVE